MEPFFLQSQRLGFRHWMPEDLSLARSLWGNPEVVRWIHAKGVFSPEEIAARLDHEMDTQRRFGIQYWPLCFLASGTFAGCCGLRLYEPRPGTLELGVHLLPQFWHQGVAQEAARRVMAYAFDDLKAEALFAGHHPGNTASRELLSRLGFAYTHGELYPPTGLQHPSYLMRPKEMRS
jgi:RimJ/RimL family protein N-acetyltransferase